MFWYLQINDESFYLRNISKGKSFSLCFSFCCLFCCKSAVLFFWAGGGGGGAEHTTSWLVLSMPPFLVGEVVCRRAIIPPGTSTPWLWTPSSQQGVDRLASCSHCDNSTVKCLQSSSLSSSLVPPNQKAWGERGWGGGWTLDRVHYCEDLVLTKRLAVVLSHCAWNEPTFLKNRICLCVCEGGGGKKNSNCTLLTNIDKQLHTNDTVPTTRNNYPSLGSGRNVKAVNSHAPAWRPPQNKCVHYRQICMLITGCSVHRHKLYYSIR